MKRIVSLLLIVCAFFTISACSNSNDSSTFKAYTFSVGTGDKIKLQLDTSNGYDITSDLPFEILKDDETLSQGVFITVEDYEAYFNKINSDTAAEILDSGEFDFGEYIFWNYNNSEYNVALLIKDSKTGILLGNNVSEESARECFNRLTIEIK